MMLPPPQDSPGHINNRWDLLLVLLSFLFLLFLLRRILFLHFFAMLNCGLKIPLL